MKQLEVECITSYCCEKKHHNLCESIWIVYGPGNGDGFPLPVVQEVKVKLLRVECFAVLCEKAS